MRRLLTIIAIAAAIGLLAGPARARMYKWTDEEGVVHWSNQRPGHETAEERFEFPHREEVYRQRRHTPETDPPVPPPEAPPPTTGAPPGPPPDHPWADQALLILKDISSLVSTVGATYQDYKALTQEAAMMAGRVAERERREELFDILALHEIALSCWYNDIFSREPFPRRMSDLKYRIFREYDLIVQTYEECLQEMWTLAPKQIRHYEDRFR
jgi:hypothetical protein